MNMTNWKELLEQTMENTGETMEDIISNTLTEEEMLEEFDNGFGCPKGKPFTIWTENFVYFPLCCDGMEWVEFVARHPNSVPTRHRGGW